MQTLVASDRAEFGEVIMRSDPSTRRRFVRLSAAAGAGVLTAGFGPAAGEKPKGKQQEEEVSPAEDLMREHGVLKRALLVYGEAIRRMDARQDLPPEPL